MRRSPTLTETHTVRDATHRRPSRALSTRVLLSAALVALTCATASAQLHVIAREGDPTPDGFTYKNLGLPVMAADGSVVFPYFVARAFNDDFTGIARWSAGGDEVLVSEATPVPGGAPGDVFQTVPAVSMALNTAGDLASNATIEVAPFVIDVGVLRKPVGAAHELPARDGDAEPGGNGTLSLYSGQFGSPPTINSAGSIATSVRLDGTSGGTADNAAILRFDGGGAPPVMIARRGDAAPGVLGGTLPGTFGGNGWFPAPTMNSSGTVAFHSLINGLGSGHAGVFKGNGGPITRIARFGDTAPGTGGLPFNGFGGSSGGSSTPISDSGRVAFAASYTGVPHGLTGVFHGDGSSISPVALLGDAAPTVGGGTDGTFGGFNYVLQQNALGQILFGAGIFGSSSSSNFGLFLWSGGSPVCIARDGQAIPGGGDTFYDVVNFTHNDVALTDAGDVILRSRILTTSGPIVRGLYRRSAGGGMTEILRDGDPLDGSTVAFFDIRGLGDTPSGARDSLGTNAAGDVAVWVQLANLTRLIATTAPDGPWVDVGGGSPGVNGVPSLSGSGSLQGGTPFGIQLVSGPPSAPALSWLSVNSMPISALGGTVHATPFINQFLFGTDGAGEVALNSTWPAGLPSATDFWLQFICQDVTVPAGLTLSNGLQGTTP